MKLPVLRTTITALLLVFRQPGTLVRFGWAPFLACIILLTWMMSVDPGSKLVMARALATVLIEICCFSLFFVRWHQALMFGASSTPPVGGLWRGFRRVLRYAAILYGPVLFFFFSMIAAQSAHLPALAAILMPPTAIAMMFTFVMLVVFIRCALVFPAAAYDRPLGFSEAWQLLRGNTWRLFGSTLTAFVAMNIAFMVVLFGMLSLASLVGAPVLRPEPDPSFLLMVPVVALMVLYYFLGLALLAATLTIFYRQIVIDRTEVSAA